MKISAFYVFQGYKKGSTDWTFSQHQEQKQAAFQCLFRNDFEPLTPPLPPNICTHRHVFLLLTALGTIIFHCILTVFAKLESLSSQLNYVVK